jgi:hypothetical protein
MAEDAFLPVQFVGIPPRLKSPVHRCQRVEQAKASLWLSIAQICEGFVRAVPLVKQLL